MVCDFVLWFICDVAYVSGGIRLCVCMCSVVCAYGVCVGCLVF